MNPAGTHLTADLAGCRPQHPWMGQPDRLRQACLDAVRAAGLTVVGTCFHGFAPAPGETIAGVTGVVLLAESHLAVHTWPERGVVTLDVFVCNLLTDNAERAEAVLAALTEGFQPAAVQRQTLARRIPDAVST